MHNKLLLCAILTIVLTLCSKTFAANWLYTVRPGDTLWDLCQRYTNEPECWRKLDKVNNVIYPRRLPLGFVISFPVEWLKKKPTPVEVSFVKGDVSVQLQQNTKAQAVSVGDKLPIGAKVITKNGDINLIFADGSSMQLEPNSELILDAYSVVDGEGIVDSRLRLNQGAVKTRVIKRNPTSRFQITTPAAVAAVRGTQYRVSSIPGEKTLMRGEVFEGLIDVSSNNILHPVAAGYGIVAKEGEPLAKPRQLVPSPIFTVSEESQMLPAIISWQSLDGALSYQIEILEDNGNDELIQRLQLSALDYTITALETGCYQIRLRGIDREQLQGLAAQQKLCIVPSLNQPILDIKNIHYEGRFESTLNWAAIENAVNYRVQMAEDTSFNTIVDERLVTESMIVFKAKVPQFVRVQALGKEKQATAFSNTIEWKPKAGSYWLPIIVCGLIAFVIL